MNVYAHTDDGDRFLMFIASSLAFAHKNAGATRWRYEQRIVAYEVDGKVYKFADFIPPWPSINRLS